MAETIVRRDVPNETYTVARLVWTLLWIIEAFLGLRFILRLVAANPAAGFTDFIYRVSRVFLNPFLNVVRNTSSGTAGGVIEWSTLLAMIVYWLLAWAIVRLVTFNTPRARERGIDYVNRVDRVEGV